MLKYGKEITALVVVDPHNDFISESGKIWDRIKGVAEANNCAPNLLRTLNVTQQAGKGLQSEIALELQKLN